MEIGKGLISYCFLMSYANYFYNTAINIHLSNKSNSLYQNVSERRGFEQYDSLITK